jgi:hypothetical protein
MRSAVILCQESIFLLVEYEPILLLGLRSRVSTFPPRGDWGTKDSGPRHLESPYSVFGGVLNTQAQ